MKSRKNRARSRRRSTPPGHISRRTFLASSALTGAAATMPSWLGGCAPLPGFELPVIPERETRTLHFDLSHVDGEATFRFHAPRSKSHGMRLSAHSNETRARFRAENALLRQIPDGQLTHYAEQVDLPGKAMQHTWVTMAGEDGIPSIVTSQIHVPSYAWSTLATAKRRAVMRGYADRVIDPATDAKLRYLKIANVSQSGASDTLTTLNSISSPIDAATSVVFHHPEIMNLDPSEGVKVLDVIKNLRGTGTSCTGENVGLLTALACSIASQGPGSTNSGWMRRVPATDASGAPVLDSKGAQIYDNRMSDETSAAAEPVIKEILRQLFNDPTLQGMRFEDNPGVTSVGADGTAAADTGKTAGQQSGAFRVSLAHPAGSVGSNLHGLLFRDFRVTDGDARSVSIEVENIYLRFLDAYVQYLQADKRTPITGSDGQPMKPQHLRTVPTDNAIMGIPLLDQGTLQKTTLSFEMPESASYANILFGTLGAGGKSVGDRDHFDIGDLIHSPMAWTLVVNIGIPSFLLALGVGLQSSGLLSSITEDPEILLAIAAVVVPLFIAGEATRGAVTGSARGPIVDTANVMIALCLRSIPKLTASLLGYATTEELEDSIPFVGWALRALGIIGGVAQLAQTVGEVLSSPAVFDNTVSFAMDTTVTVRHDPRDFEFPATAKVWIVRATYDGTVVRETCGQLPTTQSDPIEVTFSNVPVGGTVQIDVWFLSDDNWIVGQGGTGYFEDTGDTDQDGNPVQRWVSVPLSNFPEHAGEVDITIKEQLVPLTATTVYSHKEKIAYENGAHVWVADKAPTETIANLDSTRDDTLHALNSLTVQQTAGAVGYAWRTGSPQIDVCPNDNGSARSLQLIQNLSLTQRPDDALKTASCGRIDQRAIAYSLMAPFNSAGRNLYVDPVYGPYKADSETTLPYRYFVRSVALDSLTDKTPFAEMSGKSWGFFTLPSNGLAVHPMGHIASINSPNSKLEILHLPGDVVDDDEATCASMLAGAGSVPGLLSAPTGIAVAPNGAFLVLDAGNKRVQAFDTSGNVNNVFSDSNGDPLNYFSVAETEASQFLDIAVEAAVGYVFVLYYINDGTQASDYIVDIYTKDGAYLTQTSGVSAARIGLDYWRNMYTLNYEAIVSPGGRVEPSISQWIPSTPPGEDPNALAALKACSF